MGRGRAWIGFFTFAVVALAGVGLSPIDRADAERSGVSRQSGEDTEAAPIADGAGPDGTGRAGPGAPGGIRGTVTTEDGGGPIEGLCVTADGIEGTGGGIAVTDAAGRYVMGDLPADDYRVAFNLCASTDHVPEFHGDSPDAEAATPVTVAADAFTGDVDAVLAPASPAAPPPVGATSDHDASIVDDAAPLQATGAAHITGTVTADDSNLPLEGICVYAYDPETDVYGSATTGPDGAYDIGGLGGGGYQVDFRDCREARVYLGEYFDDTADRGSATLVAVAVGATVTGIDAGLAVGGRITGTVTADDTGLPLKGICVSADDPVTDDHAYAGTGPDGVYRLGGLGSGSYRIRFDDCNDAQVYVGEYFDDTADYDSATPVAVAVGETASGIDAGLAVGGRITGTVTADDTGLPLEGICVSAYDPVTDDHAYAGTGPDGAYRLGGLGGGSYQVYYRDCRESLVYLAEFFDDAADEGSATPVAVAMGETVAGIDAGLAVGGRITGTVTADDSSLPLQGICVFAWAGAEGGGGSAVTGADGAFEIGGLVGGDYLVDFYDCRESSEYLREYFDDTSDYGAATPVTVAVGETASGIDAGLARGGHIAGTVTADDTGLPLDGICVSAYDPETGRGGYSGTGPDGAYDIGLLGVGSYRVEFSDCTGDDYATEYFDDAIDAGSSTLVAVAVGETASGIDAGLARSGRITGTVTADDTGLPLGGICVSAYDPDTDDEGYATTGPDGAYDLGGLSGGSYRIRFRDCNDSRVYLGEYFDDTADYGSATLVAVAVGATVAGIDAGLAVGGRITGTVTGDDSGLPLGGICVSAYDPETDDYGSVTTGSDGAYEVGGLAGGGYRVSFRDCTNPRVYLGEYFDDAADYWSATPVAVAVGETVAGIDAGLARSGRITGTVTADDTGLPLGGICVSAYDPDTDDEGYATTGPDGAYDLGGLSGGSYRIRFRDCADSGVYLTEYFDDATASGAATRVAVAVGETVSGIDAGLSRSGRIAGTVTADDTGLPLGNVCVSAEGDDGYRSARTGGDGTYDLGGLGTGSYRVSFSDCTYPRVYLGEYFDDAADYGSATPVAVVAGATTPGIDAGLAPAGHIAGTVVADDTGIRLSGICVSAEGEEGYGSATTGPDGTYDIRGLGTGSYRVRFSDCNHPAGYATEYFDDTTSYGSAVVVPVTAGETTAGIDAALALAGGHIAGTVTSDDTGLPLRDICVSANLYGVSQSARTRQDGTYDIGGLATGDYRVRFSDCTGTGAHRDEYFDDATTYDTATRVAVTAGATTDGIDAGLAAAAHITGTVTADDTGLPLQDVCVWANADDSLGGSDLTGPDGTYDIGRLGAGAYRVEFYDCTDTEDYVREFFDDATSYDSATLVTVAAAGTAADVDAGLATAGHLSGTVTGDDTGLPLDDVCVYASDRDGGFGASTRTGADGTYDLGRLAPGDYRVWFSDCSATTDYLGEYYDDTTVYDAASLVTVVGGETTTGVDAGLAVAGHLTGRVTADLTGLPLGGICVSAYGGSTSGSARTRSDGTFDVGGLGPGSYLVRYYDCSDNSDYLGEYYDDTTFEGSATRVPVGPGETVPGVDAGLAVAGHITGSLVADETGLPLPGVCVNAWGEHGFGYAQTGSDGTYDVGGLPAGGYTVWFVDCVDNERLAEFFDDTTDYSDATVVPVAAGSTTAAIDAGLALPPTRIVGTVTEVGTGAPVPGAWVAVLRTSDFSIAAGAVANGSGDFSAEVSAGSYYLYVVDRDCRALR